MRWVLRIILGLIVLVALGAGALWVWKPWVPPLALIDPAPAGARVAQ
jgi:hypothetical protein